VSVAVVAAVVCAVCGPLFYGLAFARAWRERRALTAVAPAPLVDDLLVVIPARNEAARLPATLQALLADPSPHLRVVVVDDHSDDATALLARRVADERLTVVEGPGPPPPGTFGKPRALAFGIAASPHGAHVLCLDADVVVTPGLLGGLLDALRHSGAQALSGVPHLDNRSVVEEALVPAFVAAVAATHPPSRVHAARDPTAFLNGQLLLVRREALEDVGGFLAVQDTVLEDVALARLLKARGHALRVVDVRALARTRMYASLREILRGFAKNARALHGRALVPLGVALAAGAWAPLLSVAVAALTPARIDDVIGVAGVVVVLGLAMANRLLAGGRAAFGVLSPLVQLVVGATYLDAAVRRRGQWRGRTFVT
jgi:cellulose synthase/poly-beta-1,6-N-acetylglucosamine synthase-like glycosyltransferase